MFTVTRSGVTLDCRGATIDASGRRYGIHVRGDGIADVTIRACRIADPEVNGVMISSRTGNGRKHAWPLAERYAGSPTRITVEDVAVTDAPNVGIYVGSYVTDAVLRRPSVSSSGSAGIYLDHSSRRTLIEDGTIERNGWGTFWQPRFLSRDYRREGIAIDSSADNVIRRNRISGNAGGGIFLYKNCQEYASTKRNSVPRWLPSRGNLIEDNDFADQPVGVWVASRQDRDIAFMECGDPAYAPGRHLDAAPDNRIRANRFADVALPARIEDDGTIVEANTVREGAEACVVVGTRARSQVLGRPVVGTVLRDNACPAGAAYRFLHGARPARFDGNRQGGGPASAVVEE